MLAHDQTSAGAFRLVRAYMDSIGDGRPLERVLGVCERGGLSRTTFYKHFENMEDLDQRFLGVYAQLTLAPSVPPGTGTDLRRCLAAVLDAQSQSLGFFRRVYEHPGLGEYHLRWFEVVEGYLGAASGPQDPSLGSSLRAFHCNLARGVVRRFLETSVVEECDLDLTLEYLRGGLSRLQAVWSPDGANG